ncbi:cation transporter [Leptospira sp. 2 VSF19]|uniref:Cation transporter n=1 Tax=Leptospira soteropolitanensis TaxID=2950025 RepID=A0AAW5VR57_9LEPT|nr:cation transporter [Leptospira soteropolitanensis]MCW7493509.1 cation transporter [Leptospira soteropolitanensis]MCW7500959.1 cation transporter [Leptospira soteropolitanensis]MCW7523361.1 cation transporter [Leptospira soteropolitanensis]MCW7527222.1 cation transporter [Leptospira soteropolitanensis]MCW7531079.1 cation transporter [Leptospira soteropolitanensis]
MVNYEVEGMTCGHCKKTVEKVFAEFGTEATANLDDKSVTVKEILTDAELNKLRDRLSEDGYTLGNVK